LKQFLLALLVATFTDLSAAESLADYIDKSLKDVRTLQKMEEAKKVLEEKPFLQNNAYFQKKHSAATLLGDYSKVIEVAKEWINKDSSEPDARLIPRWDLSWLMFYLGDIDEGIRISEEVFKYINFPNQEAQFAAQYAMSLAHIGRFQEAKTNLERAQSALTRDLAVALNPNRQRICSRELAKIQMQRVNASLLALQGKHELALQELDKALEAKTPITACEGNFRDERNDGVRAYVWTMGDKVKLLLQGNKIEEAEVVMSEAFTLLIQKKNLVYLYNRGLDSLTPLMIAQGKWSDARRFAELYEEVIPPQATVSNFVGLDARSYRVDALTGLSQWQEALALQEATDKLVENSPVARALWHVPLRRSLVFLKNQRIDEAVTMGREAFEQQSARVGPAHFLTSQAAGIYAMALFAQGNLVAARTYFDMAVAGATHPHGIANGAENTGINKLYSQLILHDYLRLLEQDYKNGEKSAADKAFRVAELLRGSSVQRSIVEAAARSSTHVPGLDVLVRQEQDDKYQLNALYELLNRKLSEGRTQLPPEVIKDTRIRIADLEAELKSLIVGFTKNFPNTLGS